MSESDERYRRLPTGAHGLDPEEVERDQRERLQTAMVELIAERGYQAVRILDLTKLARVSRPTFYGLYTDKEDLFLAAYDEIARRTVKTTIEAYQGERTPGARLRAAMRAFAELAATAPEPISLVVLGAFGAGPKAVERSNHTLEALEQGIRLSLDGGAFATEQGHGHTGQRTGGRRNGSGTQPANAALTTDITVKVILGGIREVTAARLRQGRAGELPGLATELAAWAGSYPAKLPAGLQSPPPAKARARQPRGSGAARVRGDGLGSPPSLSERALRAEGRLPSGRHDLSRQFVVKNQRERIVDATAAIVAEKGLAGLTIPEIARRAKVSHQTFYEMYPTKQDAFLGAQKVGIHQALLLMAQAYDTHKDDWPKAVAVAPSVTKTAEKPRMKNIEVSTTLRCNARSSPRNCSKLAPLM